MSQWTHVAGIIRLDNMGICIIQYPERPELEKILIECIVEKLGKLPPGSEGPVQYQINSYGKEHGLSWGDISFQGDLRDIGIEEYPEIKKWFEESCKRFTFDPSRKRNELLEAKDIISNSFSVRNAVLLVDLEFGKDYVLVWNSEQKKATELKGYYTKRKR